MVAVPLTTQTLERRGKCGIERPGRPRYGQVRAVTRYGVRGWHRRYGRFWEGFVGIGRCEHERATTVQITEPVPQCEETIVGCLGPTGEDAGEPPQNAGIEIALALIDEIRLVGILPGPGRVEQPGVSRIPARPQRRRMEHWAWPKSPPPAASPTRATSTGSSHRAPGSRPALPALPTLERASGVALMVRRILPCPRKSGL